MALASGTRLGAYEILSAIGAGGMGEVYRARDTKLNRDVAIKVLPDLVASDAERLARFTREAQTLASLNHPNIAHIHGLEESSSGLALVMELVEGDDLSLRIARGAIPLVEALPIAKQIAEALEAAHEQGIIHRDLKPANIKVRPDGSVKVLDFGLAKTIDAAGSSSASAMNSPTQSMQSHAGIILGTAAYMSPEQAAGKPLDRRSDVWAFGVVMLEMLTGQRVFTGETVSHVLASVLKSDPDWTALPADTPPAIRRLLRRCLERDPKARVHDIGDARLEIEDAVKGLDATAPIDAMTHGGTTRHDRSRRVVLGVAALLALAALAIAAYVLGSRRGPGAAQEVRLEMPPPNGTHFVSVPAVAPDGRQIAFVTAPDTGGPSRLWIRLLSADAAIAIAGTDDASFPFWSPDSRSVAFFAAGKLKRLNLTGGNPIVMCDAAAGRGGLWLENGSIVFAPSQFEGLMRVGVAGGEPTPFTKLASDEVGHRFPQRLPDGHLMYLSVNRTPEKSGTRLIAIDDPERQLNFFATAGAAEYLNGFLLFVRRVTIEGAILLGQRVVLPGGQLTGDPIEIGRTRISEVLGRYVVSSSPRGVIAFQGRLEALGQFTWMSRDGRAIETIGTPVAQLGVELSPNGQRVAAVRSGAIWALDLARPVPNRVTQAANRHPIWSPDGTRIASLFQGRGINTFDLVTTSVTTGTVETLLQRTVMVKPVGWSRDGQTLVWIQSGEKGTERSIWMMPVADPKKAAMYLQDGAQNLEARLSPDGKWIAYATDRSGRFEVEVRSFPIPGARLPVSLQGGGYPRWRADGRELYYLSPDSQLMAVTVTPSDPLVFGNPARLFEVHLVAHPDRVNFAAYEYDVSADGSRFLINRQIAAPVTSMTVVLNWAPQR